MALGIGVSINNAKAVVDAIWTAIKRKPSEFVRTPKYGVRGKVKNDWKHREDPLIAKAMAGKSADVAVTKPNFLTLKRLTLPIIEIAFGCYMSSFIFISLWYSYARGSVPFLMMFAGG